MSNLRIFIESQDSEANPKAELELSLSQLLVQPSQPAIFSPLSFHLQDEVGPSRPLKKPCVEQRWHENLDSNTRALVILLQVRCVERNT